MISIIISSANSTFLNQISENVAATIGVPYEIIATDNSKGEKGMCEVYNIGTAKAKYETLVFMHEDILIKTDNWGQTLLSTLKENPDVGLIGIVGSAYKSLAPSGWACMGLLAHYSNIIQQYKFIEKEPEFSYRNPRNEKLTQVACIDGVWFCTTKKIAQEIKFDEANFTGFHLYDLDFSLAVGQKYKVAVTYDILLEHFSEGRFDQSWMLETLKLQEKWSKILPINCDNLPHKDVVYIEKATFKHFIKRLPELNLPIAYAYKMLWLNNRYMQLDVKLFFKLLFYTIKQQLKNKQV